MEETPPASDPKQASLAVAGGNAFIAAINGIFYGFKKETPENPLWGVLPPTVDAEKRCQHWLNLIGRGCRGFAVLDNETDATKIWPSEFNEHRFLSPYRSEVAHAKNLDELCQRLSGGIPEALPLASIGRYVEAILLNKRLENFSHGSEGDVVNLFLAPARLHSGHDATDEIEGWKEVWKVFEKKILTEETGELEIGKELVAACKPVSDWLDRQSSEIDGPIQKELERVMMLLTQVRTLADQRSRSQQSSPQKQDVAALGERGCFHLLVVDDHAASWRPVFERLLPQLQNALNGRPVRIEFSLDGKVLADGINEKVFFGSYDLVLLDIFLGSRSGTDLLAELRRDFSQLPVLLWTTSRDEEITGAARLANGIILKKTVTGDALVQSLADWAIRGRALRSRVLPNPFFNHTIQSEDLRELAVDFHEWCLKQLDSFHALDGEFFRYFTDHGGRHIVKLWELLGKAIEPFLHDDDTLFTPASAPVSTRQREIEIAGLYLAVICHELGMFPMRVGKKVEDFASLPGTYLKDVRSLHAIRGMVMMADKEQRFWNDARGRALGERLHNDATFGTLAYRLGALVGYHARVFKSLSESAFLEWKGKPADGNSPEEDLKEKVDKLESTTATLFQSGDEFAKAFGKISDKISNPDERKRLRNQCALFRFVDALDVSFTRNPAEFLSAGKTLPATQYRENLKREVCEEAKITDGLVEVKMRVGQPDPETIRKIVSYLVDKNLGNKEANSKAKEQIDKTEESRGMIESPWLRPGGGHWDAETIKDGSPAVFHKPLDEWLERAWGVLTGGKDNSEFVQHLRDLKVLDPSAQDPTLTREGAGVIASVTALSVAGELLDEYRAIVEADLQEKIKLHHHDGTDSKGWKWEKQAWGKDKKLDSFPSFKPFLLEDHFS